MPITAIAVSVCSFSKAGTTRNVHILSATRSFVEVGRDSLHAFHPLLCRTFFWGQSSTGSCRHCSHEEAVHRFWRLLTDEEVSRSLLCFISSLLQKLRYLCTASDHPFLLIFRSSVALVTVTMKKSSIASAVLPPTIFQSLPSFRLGRVHGLCRPSFFLSLSISERLLSPESGHAGRCSLPLEVGFQF